MFHIQWNLLIHSVWFEMRAHTHPKKLWIKIYSSWSSWIETITFWNSDSNSRWLGRELHREWHDFEFVFFWWHFFSDVLIVLHSHNSRLIFIDHKCRLFSPFIPYFVPVKNATNTQLEPLLNERMNEYLQKPVATVFVELCINNIKAVDSLLSTNLLPQHVPLRYRVCSAIEL